MMSRLAQYAAFDKYKPLRRGTNSSPFVNLYKVEIP